MSERIQQGSLQVARELHDLLEQDILPGTGVESADDAATTQVSVSVQRGPAVPDALTPDAVLFVFARRPGQAGPPLAEVRTTARAFPVEVGLSDADVMLPGTQLADLCPSPAAQRQALATSMARHCGKGETKAP